MSQEDVRRLLLSLDGEATFEELSQLARERHPNRTLYAYLGERLKAMQNKDIVEKPDGSAQIWRLTDKGTKNKIGDYNISEIDSLVNKNDLSKEKIEVSNIIGSTKLNSSLKLEELATVLQNTEYNPETSPNLVYRAVDGRVTLLAHSTGSLVILGSNDTRELISGIKEFMNSVSDLEDEAESVVEQISIDNIVAKSNFGQELDLAAVAVALEFEKTEYNPEQFPGLIYRSNVNPTILIFASGKCVITGAKTYAQILDAHREVINKLTDIGVELSEFN
jgi:transcription initiation factor TFIID TATA-box-binding protein